MISILLYNLLHQPYFEKVLLESLEHEDSLDNIFSNDFLIESN